MKPNCKNCSLQYKMFSPNTTAFTNSSVFEDVYAVTNYTIEVLAVNDKGYNRSVTIWKMTGELRKLCSLYSCWYFNKIFNMVFLAK